MPEDFDDKKVSMIGNSKEVESNQTGIHKDLEGLVLRYFHSEFQRPVADHTRIAFEAAQDFIAKFQAPIVLDSGCGTGLSTLNLAKRFPANPVIGVDKSEVRLSKADARTENGEPLPKNVFYVRAELLDFWKLAKEAEWDICFHALFYPNPWPKGSGLRYRFHGSPIFPTLVQLSPELEMRTNWKIYADEFRFALELASKHLNWNAKISEEKFVPSEPISAFEKKFKESGHALYKVRLLRSSQ
ncbi:MAG: methyltransferase domain-containing protein [Hallerella sp.]|nr:methyltransferase domain-containing protein [Hallerella sp.]